MAFGFFNILRIFTTVITFETVPAVRFACVHAQRTSIIPFSASFQCISFQASRGLSDIATDGPALQS